MIDRDLVTRKMTLIAADLAPLESLASKDRESYLASPTDELVAERLLERMIGRMIDINFHLITEAGEAPPADYYESFTRLARVGVLEHDFAPRIAGSAGLRNRIVHEYDEIDPARVHEALQSAAQDILAHLRQIHDYVGRASRP
ncbi:MAG: hypothetical protein A2X52_08555 [Candidatus Rokubacteria bacterium GWC2_70_16]|nr:MAG: hypothetical protein A2X52_08555 [Candidatus Rokubacteria bacterium GWC2_70_16]OGL13865.1 MAG: hypothetical protein A3K12_12995 [Candidatus Rokubacteria bacterium RIFCSPLOWO2_12_FULL_71_19]